VPSGTTPAPLLAASTRRVAIAIPLDRREQTYASQAFTGALGASWTALGPLTKVIRQQPNTISVQVDGDRLFAVELRGSYVNAGVTAYTPTPFDVPFYSPIDALSAVFAGDLVAYSTQVAGEEEGEFDYTGVGPHLVLREWRTGVERARIDFPDTVTPVALKPDGTVLVVGANAVSVWTPGSTPKQVATLERGTARFAGDRIVVSDQRGPRLGATRVGTPTETAGAIAADERHLLWIANGCLLAADVTDTFYGALGPGPCPRSEIAYPVHEPVAQPFARTLAVPLRCVSAPAGCKGTVRLGRLSRASRFTIPAGRTRRIRVALTGAGYARVRREVVRNEQFAFGVLAHTDDGADLPSGARLYVH
jgi:hypothetical protein